MINHFNRNVKHHKNRENSGLYVIYCADISREILIFFSRHSFFLRDCTAVSLLTWVFRTVPCAQGMHSGGLKSCWVVEVGGRFEKVCGAVCENSGARSLLVEKS